MRRRTGHRDERVATHIHHTLADALATRVKDPRVGFVTVTHVEVSADLGHATVAVSILGSEDEKSEAMEGLARARGFLRSQLARALDLRTVPELHFVLDRGLEHARRIDELLSESPPPPTDPS